MPPLIAAALIVLCEGLCFGAILPVIDRYNAALGGGPFLLGLLFALVSGPKVFSNPLFGRLSDRFGRRPVLVINTLGTFSGSVLWAVAPNVAWLAASRAVTGIFGAQAALANAIAADVSPLARRAASMAVLGAAFGLSVTFGPLLGALVGSAFSHAAVGWLCAGLQLASLLVIVFILPETRRAAGDAGVHHPAASGPDADERSESERWDRAVWRWMLVTLLAWTGFSAMNGTYQLVTRDVYGFDEVRTGIAFAVLGLVGVAVQGAAVRGVVARFGERLPAAVGIALLAAAFAGFAARPPVAVFWAATALVAIGSALLVPCLTGLISRGVSPRQQGAALGYQQGLIGLGRAGGAAGGGALYASGGAALVYGSAAAVLALSAAILVRRPRSAPVPPPTQTTPGHSPA